MPVAHQLAVRDHRQLHGLDGLLVDRALLVGAHQVGDADHGDLVDGLQTGEAGALGHVADVVVGWTTAVTARPRAAAGCTG